MDDYQSGHGLPTDFPSDPSYGGFYVIGGLSTLLLLAIIAGALLGFLTGMRDKYRRNYTDWPKQIALFIRRKCNEVIRTKDEREDRAPIDGLWSNLFGGPSRRAEDRAPRENVRDIDYAKAGLVAGYVRSLLGNSLKLGKEISGELKGLTEALEGFKEIKDPALVPGLNGPMNGGAIINIAVNQGAQGTVDPVQVIGGPYTPGGIVMPGATGPQLQPPLAIDRDANIWLAFNKFRDEWNSPDVMAGQLGSAQAQLCVRPAEPPKPY